MFSIVCEVKNGEGGYDDIPYFNGNRPDTYQDGDEDTVVKFEDGEGNEITLPDLKSYIDYYMTHSGQDNPRKDDNLV